MELFYWLPASRIVFSKAAVLSLSREIFLVLQGRKLPAVTR